MDLVVVALAALAAGMVNALAGGGTLITFPTLLAIGFPALAANVTNTVALCPGYVGGTLAQANDLKGQRARLAMLLPAAIAGGVGGALLLFTTGERLFRSAVPFLILGASALVALQGPVRAWVERRLRAAPASHPAARAAAIVAVGAAAVYGGYFGAGLSVIFLAVLGLVMDDTIARLNAVKQVLSFAVNVAAAVLFIASGEVVWPVALVMGAGAIAGGAFGGRISTRVPGAVLRPIVAALGFVVGLVYLVRR